MRRKTEDGRRGTDGQTASRQEYVVTTRVLPPLIFAPFAPFAPFALFAAFALFIPLWFPSSLSPYAAIP
jgi:hypothetical protein